MLTLQAIMLFFAVIETFRQAANIIVISIKSTQKQDVEIWVPAALWTLLFILCNLG